MLKTIFSKTFPYTILFAPPASQFQVHNDSFQNIFLLNSCCAFGEAISGTQRCFSKHFRNIFLIAPPARAISGMQRCFPKHFLTKHFAAPPARRFQVHNDTFQIIFLVNCCCASGEAALGTKRCSSMHFLIKLLFAPQARRS